MRERITLNSRLIEIPGRCFWTLLTFALLRSTLDAQHPMILPIRVSGATIENT